MNTPAPVSAAAWLDVWETAAGLAPGLREAELLRPACAPARDEDAPDLAALPLGTRDGLLLDLRRALFGAQMQCVARCPACGEPCEWSCGVDALRADGMPAVAAAEQVWLGDGWQVRFRLVTGQDIAAAQGGGDAEAVARALLERCVIAAQRGGEAVPAADLPAEVAAALGAAMAEADPQAATSVALTCPACGTAWEADFDIGGFLWTEFDAWARRTLLDVHRLASHYGWSERALLAMSPARRAHYLALVDT